jgi:hypothetical protein
MFNKRKNSESSAVLAQLAAELARLSARRDQLSRQLVEAQATLDAALAQRRRELLEDDPDGGSQGKDKVLHAREEIDALSGARAVVEERITATEARLAQARDQAARDAAITDLSPHVDALAKGIAQLQAVTQMLAPAAKEVTQRVPYGNGRFSVDLADILGAIADELCGIVGNARAHIDQLKAGDARVVTVPAPMPVPAPPPAIERVDVLLIANSAWTESGAMVTGPRWSLRPIPVAIVARAEKLGWVIRRDSEVVRRLLDSQQLMSGGPWHSPPAADCVNLETVTERPRPGSFGRSLGEVDEATPATLPGNAVETVGATVEGVASAS